MFEAMGTSMADDSWRAAAADWFTERIGDRSHGIFVVVSGGAVVACAMGSIRDAAPSPNVPEGRDVLVSNVCTLPAFRGRGFARQVFEAVLDWARATGVARAELMATPEGRGMYERAGFTLTSFPAMRADLRH